ncbi:hypothetical protein [Vannielia sp.]|uniref:hypothetical protein n=1 Tax=Vannielia sp. TaxID=2813045 RepID=UPI0026279425|nr:hypothetical protein [Vannielia sp.]MDF1874075.1 hypothetical protein [Vannielia sp.]
MAWLTPQSLTCPACGFSGEVQYLNERRPSGEKRRRFFKPGPWRKGGTALPCPTCDAPVMEPIQ